MPKFTFNGVSYEYARSSLAAAPGAVHSWEYGQWPRVEAAVPLAEGGDVSVYGQAMRWAGH